MAKRSFRRSTSTTNSATRPEFVSPAYLAQLGVPEQVVEALGYFSAAVNTLNYKAQGVEVGFKYRVNHAVSLRGGWTYTDAVVQQSFASSALAPAINPLFPDIPIGAYSPLVGARPFRIAPNTGFAGVDWNGRRWFVSAMGTFVSRRDDSTFLSDTAFGNTLLLPNRNLDPSYQKVDLYGSYQITKRISAYTSLQNVLNQKYQEVYGYPALPFTIRGGHEIHLWRRVMEAELTSPVKPSAAVARTIASIRGLNPEFQVKAQKHLDSLTKPLGSLGQLEAVAAQYVAWREEEVPKITGKAVYVFAGDHGITDEGVSAYPREVTPQMVHNFLNGGAAINVLARQTNSDIVVVDVGVDFDFNGVAGLLHRKVRRGTRNFAREAAMTADELNAALQVGIDLATEAKAQGRSLIALGEMGIGNTSAATAITAALTGKPVRELTGRGTGLDDPRCVRKAADHRQGAALSLRRFHDLAA